MKNTEISLSIKFIRIVFAFLLLMIGFASAMDFHADGVYHDNCPLCRFQMDGNAANVQVLMSFFHFISTPVLAILQVLILKTTTLYFCNNLPNAPPLV